MGPRRSRTSLGRVRVARAVALVEGLAAEAEGLLVRAEGVARSALPQALGPIAALRRQLGGG